MILAAASTFLLCCGVALFNGTGTRAAFSAQERIDHRRGATDSGLHGNGAGRAIAAARSAFHACITIADDGMSAVHFKYFMWTDFQTHSAARAFIGGKL
jgi:hypothetical protein